MVNLTRIYTRTGDAGTTRLGDMSETAKTDLRLRAYADVDETNAHLGLVLATGELDEDVATVLTHVQNDLFDVGADFCTPVVENPEYPPLRIEADYVDRLEGWCDQYNEELPKLRSFILNGGTVAGGPPARRPHRLPARGALGLGRTRAVRRLDERARHQVPQPALRPALHPRPVRQPGERRRAVGAGWRARVGGVNRLTSPTVRAVHGLFGCCNARTAMSPVGYSSPTARGATPAAPPRATTAGR